MSFAKRYESLMERRPPSLIAARNLVEEADAEIAALHARVEALEAFVESVTETTSTRWIYEEGRALLEKKP